MRDNGKTNGWVAWGLTVIGAIGTITSIILLVQAHHANVSSAEYALPIVSIILLIAGLFCLNMVCVTTCTLDKERNRFIWRRKQVFHSLDEKRFPITSIKSIEVTQKRVSAGQDKQSGKAFWWFIITKSGVRFEELGAGSASLYEADRKANRIREFLGGSLVQTAQDPLGNERGIGDRTIMNVLAQLNDPNQRNKD
jgi:hypothetical protein